MFRIFLKICGEMKSFLRRETNTNKANARAVSNAFSVLKNMHLRISKSDKVTTNDCATLLQHSLNKCTMYLRLSKNGLNTEQVKFWPESYYQSLLLFPGKNGLTPYKLKMLLIPQIMDTWFVQSPWHHMCEAMEKSNHHAHKDFQTKTKSFFSHCHYLDIVSKHKRIPMSDTIDKLQKKQLQQTTTDSEICKNVVKPAMIEVSATRDSIRLQSGLRFHVVGHFTGTTGKTVGDTITRLGVGG